MNSQFRRHLNQSGTYWPMGANDGFGGTGYGAPEPIKCRFEERSELFRDSEGREATSSAVVYTDEPLAIGGYFAPVTSVATNPKVVDGAFEVRQIAASPNLRNDDKLHKAFL